jgi:hypothetical protein
MLSLKSKEHYNSYQGYKEIIEEINNLRFYLYEQNRKIKELKYLHIKETNEVIEVNPELIKKYDITNKSIELINSNYNFSYYPNDPYLAACMKAFQFDINNINYIEEQVLKRYIIWRELEDKKNKYLLILLGPKANESNYIELQNIELNKYYELLDKCDSNYSYSITL